MAILGFKLNLWFAVAALAGHGVFDFVHAHLISNPGVPAWWPGFCLTYDVAAAAYLAWILRTRLAARRFNAENLEGADLSAAPCPPPSSASLSKRTVLVGGGGHELAEWWRSSRVVVRSNPGGVVCRLWMRGKEDPPAAAARAPGAGPDHGDVERERRGARRIERRAAY